MPTPTQPGFILLRISDPEVFRQCYIDVPGFQPYTQIPAADFTLIRSSTSHNDHE